MAVPNHLTCLLRNLYAGQEETVRTGHGTTDWFQIGKGVCICMYIELCMLCILSMYIGKDCILLPCLINLYAEYLMQNAGLDEAQAGIKIAGRNINNLRYADAAAKSLQSCLTLCDPIDGSPPGSPAPGILQAKTLEWVAISLSNA